MSDRRAFHEGFVEPMYRRLDVRAAFDGYVADGYLQHNPSLPDGPPVARDVLDIYRAEGDHIVEHRAVLPPWPVSSANDHPMF